MTVMNQVTATCSFEECSESMIGRVVGALVDQLCAHVDVDIALLDALEDPLDECLVILHPFGVTGASVSAASGVIMIEIHLASPLTSESADSIDADDVITTFFDVTVANGAASVMLVGSLR